MVQKLTKILGLIALTGLTTAVDAQYSWSQAGPVYTAGRARNMIVDKADASGNTLYVGSTSSGIFKTTDGGVNWVPLDDQGLVRNISYMAQAPDGTIYAGTGEGFLRTGQKTKALPGTGLYKLTGASLSQVVSHSVVGTVINRVAVSPANSAVVAITTNKGVYISQDAGANFALANGIPTSTAISGQDVKFDNSGVLYCTAGAESGPSNSVTPSTQVYKSTDATLSSFIAITPSSSVLGDAYYGRVELAIAPSNNNIIYASCANKNPSGSAPAAATLKGLFVSYNAGLTWALAWQGSAALDPLSNGGTVASGDYAHCLLVSPSNPHQLFFGGFQMYVYTRKLGHPGDSDTNPIPSWQKLGNHFVVGFPLYLHQNIHDIKIIPTNPPKFYFVTDAGIYRSTDLSTSTSTLFSPSFQPFYKGLVTGQFNSVSIQRFPIGANSTSTVNGTKITPYVGFIGGTGANGMTYYSGNGAQVTQETNYIGGEVYNVEFSKLLPDAAIASIGSGELFRSTNVRNSPPAVMNVNRYSGVLSRISPNPETFANTNLTTGTPFKLWENYGQTKKGSPDSIYFYNDSLRFQTSSQTIDELKARTTFTFDAIRPNKFAMIDSIVVRTGTVALPQTSGANSPAFTIGQTITLRLPPNYAETGTLTTITGSNLVTTGNISATQQPSVVLNSGTLVDDITVTYSTAPFAAVTSTNPAYYRAFATVFYKYEAGDTVVVFDNNISTKTQSYTAIFTSPLNWRYGSAPVYTGSVVQNPSVSNPTFEVTPGNTTFNTNTYSVSTIGVKSYTITQYGDYTMIARPVVYTLAAVTDTNLPGPTYTFVLEPGAITQTAAATGTNAITFTVAPTASVATDYTITQTDASTMTAFTYSTVGATSFVLNPGNISQPTATFVVNITSATPITSYTIEGISSDPTIGANTSSVVTNFPIRSVQSQGSTIVPFSKNNTVIKIPLRHSARLAVALTNAGITGGLNAVVVSKNPLALNDPLSFVRVSQSGARTDDASGNPTNNTIVVNGRPTVLEWSKSGTELYYATDANEVYRVSHIGTINDLSPASYNGKFHNDIFMYNNASPHTPNSATLNPVSPFRTTKLGTFDAPISSLSIDNNDSLILVTFNNPAKTGTTGIVMVSTNSAKVSNSTNIGWVKKDATIPDLAIYCSMIEKDDNNKVFIGTDRGLYYTSNLNSAGVTWVDANTGITDVDAKLPNVQIFDIKQQVMAPWDCFNSGEIYVATNGRGIWTNGKYLKDHYVGINEMQKDKVSVGNNLRIFPNPSNDLLNVEFTAMANENATIQIMDLSGRVVKTEALGNIGGGESLHQIETASLSSGIYLVNISSDSGIKRVAKLVVAK